MTLRCPLCLPSACTGESWLARTLHLPGYPEVFGDRVVRLESTPSGYPEATPEVCVGRVRRAERKSGNG